MGDVFLPTSGRPWSAVVPKAKTAKIVRNIVDVLATVRGFDELQVELCKELVQWAKVGPGGYRSPRHKLPVNSQVTRVQSALHDVANTICQALYQG